MEIVYSVMKKLLWILEIVLKFKKMKEFLIVIITKPKQNVLFVNKIIN